MNGWTEPARGVWETEDRNSFGRKNLIDWIAVGLSRGGLQGRDIEALVRFS